MQPPVTEREAQADAQGLAGDAPPLPGPDAALFLDFDGTLVDIAQTPDQVVLPADLVPTLARLHARLQGAVAIITGRPLGQIDAFLAPLQLAGAGEHGAVRRLPSGELLSAPTPDLRDIAAQLDAFAQTRPGLRVERKRHGVALHYRSAPQFEPDCLRLAQELAAPRADLALLHGKAVVEFKPADVDKGRALQALMQTPPFLGRSPVFLGDDTTDEAAITAADRLGGQGVKVGPGPSAARYRLAGPVAVLAHLQAAAARLDG